MALNEKIDQHMETGVESIRNRDREVKYRSLNELLQIKGASDPEKKGIEAIDTNFDRGYQE